MTNKRERSNTSFESVKDDDEKDEGEKSPKPGMGTVSDQNH